jgi:hypothetical protein
MKRKNVADSFETKIERQLIDVLSSDWMITFFISFGMIFCLDNNIDVIMWLYNNILLSIGCYHLLEFAAKFEKLWIPIKKD